MTVITGDSKFATAKWIVSANISDGATHTTIQSAINAATAGDEIFIKPGTYTENLTLKDGVDLVSYASAGWTGNCVIKGKCTLTAGTVSINGIELETNGDYFLEITGASVVVFNAINCYLFMNDFDGIHVTNSNAGTFVNFFSCNGDTNNNNVALYTSSCPGRIEFNGTNILNSGLSTKVSNNSDGEVVFNFSGTEMAVSTSGTSSLVGFNNSFANCNAAATSAVKNDSTAALGFNTSNSAFSGGTQPAINLGAGSVALMENCIVDSSNANVLTGAGSLVTSGLAFSGTSDGQNLSQAITPRCLGIKGTWTPTITGATAAGVTTYTVQVGYYTIIGKIVYISYTVEYTAATGTGNVVLGGLPFPIKNTANQYPIGAVITTGVTFPAGTTAVTSIGTPGTSQVQFQGSGSAVANANVQMENAARAWFGSLTYETD